MKGWNKKLRKFVWATLLGSNIRKLATGAARHAAVPSLPRDVDLFQGSLEGV